MGVHFLFFKENISQQMYPGTTLYNTRGTLITYPMARGGRCGLGGKSCHLAVGGLPVRSHPGRVEVSLSETPNPRLLLTSWLVPCMAANRRWCVNVCVNG